MNRPVVATCLMASLTIGFVALFSVYLPRQLAVTKGRVKAAPMAGVPPLSLSDIVSPTPEPVSKPAPPEVSAVLPPPAPPRTVTPGTREEYYPLRPYEPLEEAPVRHGDHPFKVTAGLKIPYEFWRNVYANYTRNHTLLHDNLHLDIVYGMLDFTPLDENVLLSPAEKRAGRDKAEEEAQEQLSQMLLRFEKGEMPATAGEHLVYSLFENSREPGKFAKAADRIRAQWGQRDRFEQGLVRAGRYLPMMEEIFIREGVPKEITRLVFVESMFQMEAVSKVGAGGPWQFMPATAKLYMKINDVVDERRDPLIAAQGAARLLLKNYEQVESWPLAINGYNTGILRMMRAVRQTGGKDMGDIVARFNDPGYQFASRNFYPEFLAALEVSGHIQNYFGELQLDCPVPFDEVVLPYPTSLHRLAESTGIDIGVLKDLNPSYHAKHFEPKAAVPKGYTLRVPHQQQLVFLSALDRIHNEAASKTAGPPGELVLELR